MPSEAVDSRPWTWNDTEAAQHPAEIPHVSRLRNLETCRTGEGVEGNTAVSSGQQDACDDLLRRQRAVEALIHQKDAALRGALQRLPLLLPVEAAEVDGSVAADLTESARGRLLRLVEQDACAALDDVQKASQESVHQIRHHIQRVTSEHSARAEHLLSRMTSADAGSARKDGLVRGPEEGAAIGLEAQWRMLEEDRQRSVTALEVLQANQQRLAVQTEALAQSRDRLLLEAEWRVKQRTRRTQTPTGDAAAEPSTSSNVAADCGDQNPQVTEDTVPADQSLPQPCAESTLDPCPDSGDVAPVGAREPRTSSTEDQSEAATRLQARWRGILARRTWPTRRSTLDDARCKRRQRVLAATAIQAAWRMRRAGLSLQLRHSAAVRIQASYRGRLGRAAWSAAHELHRACFAARLVQVWWRALQARPSWTTPDRSQPTPPLVGIPAAANDSSSPLCISEPEARPDVQEKAESSQQIAREQAVLCTREEVARATLEEGWRREVQQIRKIATGAQVAAESRHTERLLRVRAASRKLLSEEAHTRLVVRGAEAWAWFRLSCGTVDEEHAAWRALCIHHEDKARHRLQMAIQRSLSEIAEADADLRRCQKREGAATRLQACFRGHQDRKCATSLRQETERAVTQAAQHCSREDAAARAIQRRWRGAVARGRLLVQMVAAIRIQAVSRGWLTRCNVIRQRRIKELLAHHAHHHSAILRIQSWWRGCSARRRFKTERVYLEICRARRTLRHTIRLLGHSPKATPVLLPAVKSPARRPHRPAALSSPPIRRAPLPPVLQHTFPGARPHHDTPVASVQASPGPTPGFVAIYGAAHGHPKLFLGPLRHRAGRPPNSKSPNHHRYLRSKPTWAAERRGGETPSPTPAALLGDVDQHRRPVDALSRRLATQLDVQVDTLIQAQLSAAQDMLRHSGFLPPIVAGSVRAVVALQPRR